MTKQEVTYQAAGVDTAEGARAVDAIKETVHSTYRPEVVGDIGGFGGLFCIAAAKDMAEPLLVSRHRRRGHEAQGCPAGSASTTPWASTWWPCASTTSWPCGAEPLFFLDYIAIGKLDAEEHVAEVVGGIGEGCRQAGCALIGGEMAEHPGVMDPDDYDLSGFCRGRCRPARRCSTPKACARATCSSAWRPRGLHSNGYSLARKVCVEGKSRRRAA